MHRVLLSCESIDDSRYIKGYIETELPYEVVLAVEPKEIEAAVRARNIHLMILQTGHNAKDDIAYSLQLRRMGFNYPLLLITDSVGETNIEEVNERHRVYFLERPFELKALKGLARKLMVSRSVPQQVFRRYRTNLSATIETFISGEKYQTHMFNLSRGGAYFELTKKPTVSVGDLLRLKINLSDMDREHQVHGRIVWQTHKGHAAGGYGLGIRFMKSTDIYRSLLDKV
ncbi:MAG: PilZ domain-containing protein [Bdellovibrionales bacterium]